MNDKTIKLEADSCVQKNESSSGAIVLYDIQEIKERVDKAATAIFQYCYKVIREAKIHDFMFDIPPSLNLINMTTVLQELAKPLKEIIDNGAEQGLDHERINNAINAREQLRRLNYLVDSLNSRDNEGYINVIESIENQAMP